MIPWFLLPCRKSRHDLSRFSSFRSLSSTRLIHARDCSSPAWLLQRDELGFSSLGKTRHLVWLREDDPLVDEPRETARFLSCLGKVLLDKNLPLCRGAPFPSQLLARHTTSWFSLASIRKSLSGKASCHPHKPESLTQGNKKTHLIASCITILSKSTDHLDPDKIALIVCMRSETSFQDITILS